MHLDELPYVCHSDVDLGADTIQAVVPLGDTYIVYVLLCNGLYFIFLDKVRSGRIERDKIINDTRLYGHKRIKTILDYRNLGVLEAQAILFDLFENRDKWAPEYER